MMNLKQKFKSSVSHDDAAPGTSSSFYDATNVMEDVSDDLDKSLHISQETQENAPTVN
jgi:hypothetical protein